MIMQKDEGSRSAINQIKLCGYLKKKRNRVGGWRKLWFVLHDRLLVSYASQEEYDNKLTSFKDVLNLVPGTQVRPSDNNRFTIETTTQVLYTFHCEDHTAYRQWIAMLLDQCAGGGSTNCSRRFNYCTRQEKIPNWDLVITRAEHDFLLTNEEKKMFDRNFHNESVHELRMNYEGRESQTLKKQIERMNISGSEEYKHQVCSSGSEERCRCKMVSTKSMEHSLVQLAPGNRSVKETSSTKTDEPVYAVVDLKHKYDQRKKRSALMEEKRCSSYESIYAYDKDSKSVSRKSLDSLVDTVYEDGDAFFDRNASGRGLICNTKNSLALEEENIYEPINIVGQKTSMFEFRKYIARLKLKPLLRTGTATPRKPKVNCIDIKNPNGNTAMSRFSTLRWKLGKHRKSVQRRMRKLCSREYEPNPLFQYHKEENSKAFTLSSLTQATKESTAQAINSTKTVQTENSQQSFDNLPAFKRALAKIPLPSITTSRIGNQSPN